MTDREHSLIAWSRSNCTFIQAFLPRGLFSSPKKCALSTESLTDVNNNIMSLYVKYLGVSALCWYTLHGCAGRT